MNKFKNLFFIIFIGVLFPNASSSQTIRWKAGIPADGTENGGTKTLTMTAASYSSCGDPDDFWQFGNVGGGSRRASRRASRTMRINSGPRYNNRSTRILNVNIHSSLSVADIVNDIERLESMNEASFFNGVM